MMQFYNVERYYMKKIIVMCMLAVTLVRTPSIKASVLMFRKYGISLHRQAGVIRKNFANSPHSKKLGIAVAAAGTVISAKAIADGKHIHPDAVILTATRGSNLDYREHYKIGENPFRVEATDKEVWIFFNSRFGVSTVTRHMYPIQGNSRHCLSVQCSDGSDSRSIQITSHDPIVMQFKTFNWLQRIKHKIHRNFKETCMKPGVINVVTK